MTLRLFGSVVKSACTIAEERVALLSYLGLRNYTATPQVSNPNISASENDLRGKHKDHPVMVASHANKCIVGCTCTEDSPTVNWFFLEEGPAQTCDCGYYFKLEKLTQDQWIPKYSKVMQVDESRPDPRKARRGLPFVYDDIKGSVFKHEATKNNKTETP